jgi:hypothetical protein
MTYFHELSLCSACRVALACGNWAQDVIHAKEHAARGRKTRTNGILQTGAIHPMRPETFVHPIQLGSWLRRTRQVKNAGTVHVVCCVTRSDYLAIHPSGDRLPGFVITYLPDGFAVMRGFPSIREAQLCAAVLDRIIDWSADLEGLWEQYHAMPQEIRDWMDRWDLRTALQVSALS